MSTLDEYWKLCKAHRDIYATKPLKLLQYPRRYERVIEFLQQAGWQVKTVLEVGCLTGYGMEILSKAGYDLLGIEVSRQAIQKRVNRNIIAASIEHLPFKDKAFDLVFSVAVLEHLGIAGVDFFLKELMRVGRYNYHSPAFACGYEEGWHSTVRPLGFWTDRLKNLGGGLDLWHLEDIVWADGVCIGVKKRRRSSKDIIHIDRRIRRRGKAHASRQ